MVDKLLKRVVVWSERVRRSERIPSWMRGAARGLRTHIATDTGRFDPFAWFAPETSGRSVLFPRALVPEARDAMIACARAGAREIVAADACDKLDERWTSLRADIAQAAPEVEFTVRQGDLADPWTVRRLPATDVVYYPGYIIHDRDPLQTIQHLRRLTRHRTFLTSMVVPPFETTIEGRSVSFGEGKIKQASRCSYVERLAFDAALRKLNVELEQLQQPVQGYTHTGDILSQGWGWHWFFTENGLIDLCGKAGFEKRRRVDTWTGRAIGLELAPAQPVNS